MKNGAVFSLEEGSKRYGPKWGEAVGALHNLKSGSFGSVAHRGKTSGGNAHDKKGRGVVVQKAIGREQHEKRGKRALEWK